MTAATLRSAGRPARLIRRLGAALGFLNRRRTFDVVLLAVAPLLVGVTAQVAQSSSWTYYLGDSVGLGRSLTFRVSAVALAERASHLQGAAPGQAPRYRWTERTGNDDLGVVEMGAGQASMQPRAFPGPAGDQRGLGLVENDLGAIVMRIDGATANDCKSLRTWTSGYTRRVSRMAFVPPAGAKPSFEAIRAASWIPLEDAEPGCTAIDAAPRTILVRFDP